MSTVPAQRGSALPAFRPGFLDAIAEREEREPTAQNFFSLGGGHIGGVSGAYKEQNAPEYLAMLEAGKAVLSLGGRYPGYTAAQCDTIDRIAASYGTSELGGNCEELDDEDMVFVAEKYGIPPLLLCYPKLPQGFEDDDPALRGLSKRLQGNVSHRALLQARAHCLFHSMWAQRAWGRGLGDQHRIWDRATWYDPIPPQACGSIRDRKRKRHAAAAERILGEMATYANGRGYGTLAAECRLAATCVSSVIASGQVPQDETEMLVAEVATYAQQLLDTIPRELPAGGIQEPPGRSADLDASDEAPAGAVESTVISDAEAAADELDRARESVIGSMRRRLEAKPDATDRELANVGQSKYRAILRTAGIMAEVIAEARTSP